MDDTPDLETELATARLSIRRVTQQDAQILRRIRDTDAVRRWWGVASDDPAWPMSETDARSFAIWSGGVIVGFIQYYENSNREYFYAGIDLFLDVSAQGRGLGREAIMGMISHLVEDRGHHRIVIDPAAHNTHAIACYRACGFRDVGVMQMYERDRGGEGWHDGLLMEYVVRP